MRFSSTLSAAHKLRTVGVEKRRDAHSSDRGGPFQTAAYGLLAEMMSPVESLCMRTGVTPRSLTIGSLLLSLLGGVAAAAGMLATGGMLYLTAGVLDLLDGRVARNTGTASPRGAALDSMADRFAEAFVVGGLAWWLRGSLGSALCYVFIVASMGVSYARARGEGLGVKVTSGAMARGPRVALLGLGMCIEGVLGGLDPGHASTPFLIGLTLLTFATVVTAIGRILAVLRALPGPQIAEPEPRELPPPTTTVR